MGNWNIGNVLINFKQHASRYRLICMKVWKKEFFIVRNFDKCTPFQKKKNTKCTYRYYKNIYSSKPRQKCIKVCKESPCSFSNRLVTFFIKHFNPLAHTMDVFTFHVLELRWDFEDGQPCHTAWMCRLARFLTG